ncbi:MAG: aminotransferase [Herpetosiphonaceae bacterium]|nr:MAG: aminotransferase [Herpetosiphonaceae bacterium]
MSAPAQETIDTSAYFPRGASAEQAAAQSFSGYMMGLAGSEIQRIAAEVRALQAQGREVCNLTIGDFSPKQFPIPASLISATHVACESGNTNYPPPEGALVLRQAIARLYERDLGLRYPVESILIGSGARPMIYATYLALLNPGERVVYPVPSWNNNYYTYLAQAEAVEIPVSREDNFLLTAAQLEPYLNGARLVCLNSPLNPSGTMYSAEALRELCKLIVAENRRRQQTGERLLYVLYDQIYWMLSFGGARHHTPVEVVPEMAAYTIMVDGISKGFAATGLRVGWLVAAPHITLRMRSLLSHIGAWAPHPEQVATAQVLDDVEGLEQFRRQMRAEVAGRLEALYNSFMEMRDEGLPVDAISPQGAIYLSAQIDLVGRALEGRRFESNEDIRRFLLEEAGVAVVPFNAFGLNEESGWMRLSVGAASREQIERGMQRIAALLARTRA